MNLTQKDINKILVDTEDRLSTSYQTVEQQVLSYNEFLQQILSKDTELISRINFLKGELNDPSKYNRFFTEIYKKIKYLFQRAESLQSKLVNGVSAIEAETNLIFQDIKTTRSLLNILSLYNITSDDNIFYFSDTFTDFSKVNFDNTLGPVTNCFVSTDGGVVTLPRVSTTSLIGINTKYVILPGSTAGASFTPGKELNQSFINTTPNWAEYSISSDVATLSLNLRFLLILDDITPINHIRIEPNNFGTSNWLKINSIQISEDNITFRPLQELSPEFASVGVETALEPEFLLSDYENKFSRVGDFLFEPSNVRYIIFDLEQREPILNPIGDPKYKYLIGIRNLEINQIRYANSGTLYSKVFTRDASNKEIGSIALARNANIQTNSQAGEIQFYVSPDNQTWYSINPIEDNTGDEILYFNQPWLVNNIDFETPVTNLYVKSEFNNNLGNLDESPEKIVITKDFSEIVELGLTLPYRTQLINIPNQNTVQVLLFPYGSIGLDRPLIVKSKLDTSTSHRIEFPFNLQGNEVLKIGDIELYHSDSPGLFSTENVNKGNYSIYVNTDSLTGEKYNTISVFLKPDLDEFGEEVFWWENKDIEIRLDNFPKKPESPTANEVLNYPQLTDKYIVRTDNYTDGIKEHFKVFKTNLILNAENEYVRNYVDFNYIIPKGTLNFKIDPSQIKRYNDGGGLEMIDSLEIDFIDGITELMATENWVFSVNYYTGEVFRKYPCREDISVRCKKEVKTELDPVQFSIMPDNKGIILDISAYDPGSWYEVLYYPAILINPEYFNLVEDELELTDNAKVASYLDEINPDFKLARITYKFNETVSEPLAVVSDFFSPILKDYTITCTGLQF